MTEGSPLVSKRNPSRLRTLIHSCFNLCGLGCLAPSVPYSSSMSTIDSDPENVPLTKYTFPLPRRFINFTLLLLLLKLVLFLCIQFPLFCAHLPKNCKLYTFNWMFSKWQALPELHQAVIPGVFLTLCNNFLFCLLSSTPLSLFIGWNF